MDLIQLLFIKRTSDFVAKLALKQHQRTLVKNLQMHKMTEEEKEENNDDIGGNDIAGSPDEGKSIKLNKS